MFDTIGVVSADAELDTSAVLGLCEAPYETMTGEQAAGTHFATSDGREIVAKRGYLPGMASPPGMRVRVRRDGVAVEFSVARDRAAPTGIPNVFPPTNAEELRVRLEDAERELHDYGIKIRLADSVVYRADLLRDVRLAIAFSETAVGFEGVGLQRLGYYELARLFSPRVATRLTLPNAVGTYGKMTDRRQFVAYLKTAEILAKARRTKKCLITKSWFDGLEQDIASGMIGDVARLEDRYIGQDVVASSLGVKVGRELVENWDCLEARVSKQLTKRFGIKGTKVMPVPELDGSRLSDGELIRLIADTCGKKRAEAIQVFNTVCDLERRADTPTGIQDYQEFLARSGYEPRQIQRQLSKAIGFMRTGSTPTVGHLMGDLVYRAVNDPFNWPSWRLN